MLSVSLDESCQVHTLAGSRVPGRPLALALFQFDLQRIVIYCDSRHAELETCCDIPSGPVSHPCIERPGGNGSWASRRGVSRPGEGQSGFRGRPPLEGDLAGGPESLLGTRLLVQRGEQAVRSVRGEEAPGGA